ncbi:hypothetical protein XENTR_v10019963 [Xenopus tropicalis]|nr:hypothetical protein XENTR_v10019963 [Xenopus tropicalis]
MGAGIGTHRVLLSGLSAGDTPAPVAAEGRTHLHFRIFPARLSRPSRSSMISMSLCPLLLKPLWCGDLLDRFSVFLSVPGSWGALGPVGGAQNCKLPPAQHQFFPK